MEFYQLVIVILMALGLIVTIVIHFDKKRREDKVADTKADRTEVEAVKTEVARLKELLKAVPLQIQQNQPINVSEGLQVLADEVGEPAKEKGLLDCESLIKLGSIAFWQSDYDKAESYNRVAMDQADTSDDGLRAATLGNIGAIIHLKGDLDSALTYYSDALGIDREIGYREAEAIHLGNIGVLHHDKGNLDEAMVCYQSALAIHREVGNRLGEASTLGNLGLIHSDKSDRQDLDAALTHLNSALTIHREEACRREEASDLGNIGLVYYRKGELDKALEHYQEALEIHREVGYKRGEACTLGNIGLIHDDKDDPDEALEHYKDALAISCEIGYREGEANQLGNVALIYFEKRSLDEAQTYLMKALELFEQIGMSPKVEQTKVNIERVRSAIKRQNDKGKSEK